MLLCAKVKEKSSLASIPSVEIVIPMFVVLIINYYLHYLQ